MSAKILQITIAANDVAGMVAFYNAVFGSNLKPFEAMGFTLYQGQLAGTGLVLCPNEMLGIKAEKNRQQFDFEVADIASVVDSALGAGGHWYGDEEIVETDERRVASMSDPDGNSLVLVEMK